MNASDTAADSYHRYKEDIAIAAKLKLQVYRFSFSWSRLLPDGDVSKPNMEGVEYYHNLINEMVKHNLTPFGTVYHFDHPQVLEDQFQGWQSRQMITKFRDYARFVFKEYSSKVKMWTTINEPNVVCTYFGTLLTTAGFVKPEDYDNFKCMHYVTLAHAEAYRVFQEEKFEGSVGVNTWIAVAKPNTTSVEDTFATEVFNQLHIGSILHPVVFGDYPDMVKTFTGTQRPVFTEKEKEILKGSTDFINLNIYVEGNVAFKDPSTPPETQPFSGPGAIVQNMIKGVDFISFRFVDSEGKRCEKYPTFQIAPGAMRSALLWTWQRYKLPLVVSENGISLTKGMDEQFRYAYYSAFLRSLVSTVNDFKVNVLAYCVWSLIDTFEWSAGYDAKYGIAAVDYEGGSLNRSLRYPTDFWMSLAEQRAVPFVEIPASSASSHISYDKFPLFLMTVALRALVIFMRH
ncbi:Cyanidin 3-O-glucoside 7-O-glucosyltransferase (acyl-glucose) [Frankliniella fusca]|uniref:Cyanidin 3-O-glucoside 7-O-glucosyltransferase (Acyl-glucose) n=1 Tax=Frankliniella fusca TaxID=407009 RepID=A0AAE1LGT7_9NEOP|nr:Cyanidin 3-O-glucoside 7-O-glucosyltransferase (acyl-glucose) [Frankliniella fusca]